MQSNLLDQEKAGGIATAAPERVMPVVREKTAEATESLKAGATEVLQSAREVANDFLSEQKQRIAGKLEEYTNALNAACESLEQEEQNPLSAPARRATRELEKASGYLRNSSRTQMLGDLGDLARRKPEWVYGALFVAGLATARFLKASPPRQGATARQESPNQQYLQATPGPQGGQPRSIQPTLNSALP